MHFQESLKICIMGKGNRVFQKSTLLEVIVSVWGFCLYFKNCGVSLVKKKHSKMKQTQKFISYSCYMSIIGQLRALLIIVVRDPSWQSLHINSFPWFVHQRRGTSRTNHCPLKFLPRNWPMSILQIFYWPKHVTWPCLNSKRLGKCNSTMCLKVENQK